MTPFALVLFLVFALVFDDLCVASLVVLLELGVRHQLVDQRLLSVLVGDPIRVVIRGRIHHLTDLKEKTEKKNIIFGQDFIW